MQHSTRRWPAWLAMLTLIAGLGVGAIGLASAAGIWLGIWDFRTGFTLLAIADGHASWIAGVGLVATIVVVVFSRGAAESRALKLGALALIGTLAAAVAYYVPESYRPAPETPPIHDVSTDTTDPPHYVAILPLRADSPNTTVYGGSPNMTPERLADLQTRAFPDLKTRRFDEPPDAVFERALAAVETLGWDLVAAVPDEGRIEATDTTFWFRFKDDVVIRIRPAAAGSILDARSLSRVGGGDAGTNARRLRRFFATLDATS
jgi:Protein of unknown function (DUF1499)